MLKSIRHLNATSAEWKSHSDMIIPRGELAAEFTDTGAILLKMGNGTETYSALPYLNAVTVRSFGGGELSPKNQCTYRAGGAISNLFLKLPGAPEDNFYAEISFISGEDATAFEVSDTVYFSGDDIAGGEFLPVPSKHYTVLIWRDNGWHCVVRGVPIE